MKKLPVTVCVLILALRAFAADTIKLAITGPFSGGPAPMGASMRDGAKPAPQQINDAGGGGGGGEKRKKQRNERARGGQNKAPRAGARAEGASATPPGP